MPQLVSQTEKLLKQAEALASRAESLEAKGRAAIDRWRDDPVLFVSEAIGVNEKTRPGLKISTQQRKGLRELGKLIKAKEAVYREAESKGKYKATAEEKEYAKKIGISIMAGRGPGKDAFAAWAIIYMMSCFPYPKVPCTAPSAGQLESVLWSEIAKWLDLRNTDGDHVCAVRDWFELQSSKMFYKHPDLSVRGKRWFAEARTVSQNMTSERQTQTLAGRHEKYMLYVIDEAAGVPDPVFEVSEGALTEKCNIMLLIFNPVYRSGFAFRTHYGKPSERERWILLRWDAEKSELVSREHIEGLAEEHGRESNYFLVHVKGIPPRVESDTLIPDDWVHAAIERNIDMIPAPDDATVVGCDPALGGGCEAVICVRKGPKMLKQYIYPLIADPDELAMHVVNKANEHGADAIFIDVIGIGTGVYSYVRQYYDSAKVFAVDVRQSTSDTSKCDRLRDELWWRARERFRTGTIGIIEDETLRSQLSSIKIIKPAADGSTRVETKPMMRQRNAGGLDRADALVLTFRYDDSILKNAKRDNDEDVYEREPAGGKYDVGARRSWMVA